MDDEGGYHILVGGLGGGSTWSVLLFKIPHSCCGEDKTELELVFASQSHATQPCVTQPLEYLPRNSHTPLLAS